MYNSFIYPDDLKDDLHNYEMSVILLANLPALQFKVILSNLFIYLHKKRRKNVEYGTGRLKSPVNFRLRDFSLRTNPLSYLIPGHC